MKNITLASASIFILIGTVLFAAINSGPAHGASTGTICIIPAGASSCPSSPAPITGTVGTQLRIAIFIQNSTALNGFDITLLADHTILKPAGADLTGTVLPGPATVLVECLSGILVKGATCSSTDSIDTLHLAASATPGGITGTPTTGLFFTAIYNITATTSGMSLGFQTGCGSPTAPTSHPPLCATVANGSPTPVPEGIQTAIFSTTTTPDFAMSANPSSITMTAGSTATSTLSITSVNGLSGTVSLTATVSPASLPVTLSPTSVTLAASQTLSSTITISTTTSTPSTTYTITITGTSGSLSHSTTVVVTVTSNPPDFTITANPTSLSFAAGASGTSTISLHGVNGFNSTVFLTVSPSSGLSATISPTSTGPFGTATLTATTNTPGTYTVTVTGTSGSISHSTTLAVNVTPKGTNPLSIDGFADRGCAHNTNSCSTLFSTQHNNDIIIVFATEGLDLQTVCTFSVSDSAGLSWASRGAVSGRNDGTTGSNRDQIQEFWARSASILTSDNVTESISGCAGAFGGEYNDVIVFGITGANFNSPFDPNISLPGTASGYSNTPSAAISTSNSNDLIFGFGQQTTYGTLTPGPGFTGLLSAGPGGVALEHELVNSPVTNFSVSFNDDATWYWEMMADAVQSASSTSPDFSIAASPSSLPITAGSSATSIVTVTSLNAFSGIVTLSTATPTGLTSSLNPATVNITPGSSASSTLTVATTTSTPPGSYVITITGTSGSLSHSTSVTVTVSSPGDFSISESPTSQSIPSASEKQTVITVASINGFSGNVNLVATPSSTAVACWFTTLTNTATVFVPAGGFATQYPTCGAYSPPGAYIVTISGTSGALSHSVTLPVTVMDYGISAQSVSFNTGSSSTGTVTLTSLFGLSGPVSLAVSSPSGLSASCPTSLTLLSGGTVTGSCSFSSSTAGSYAVKITGTFVCSNCYYNAADSHSVTVTVNVQDFNVSASPTSVSITKGSQTNSSIAVSTLSLTSLNGFTGTISISASITPTTPHSPTVKLSSNSLTLSSGGSATAFLTIAAGKNTSTGTYTVNLTFTSGSITHTVAITVTVTR